jgi:hypothetical protein
MNEYGSQWEWGAFALKTVAVTQAETTEQLQNTTRKKYTVLTIADAQNKSAAEIQNK